MDCKLGWQISVRLQRRLFSTLPSFPRSFPRGSPVLLKYKTNGAFNTVYVIYSEMYDWNKAYILKNLLHWSLPNRFVCAKNSYIIILLLNKKILFAVLKNCSYIKTSENLNLFANNNHIPLEEDIHWKKKHGFFNINILNSSST